MKFHVSVASDEQKDTLVNSQFNLPSQAMVNVGGYLLSAMTIEHFILRLPYRSKTVFNYSLFTT